MLPPQWSLCNVVLRSPVGAKAERTQSEGRKENNESTAHFLQLNVAPQKVPRWVAKLNNVGKRTYICSWGKGQYYAYRFH